MTPDEALAQAIAFLQGVGDDDPMRGASYVVEQLMQRGFSVQPIASLIIGDLTPETLRRVRKGVGRTPLRLAEDTGLNNVTMGRAEHPGANTHRATQRAIVDALVRLGARRPNEVDRVQAMNNQSPEGALSGLDLDDNEGVAIRAALDQVGQACEPPVTGTAAIRKALKDYLISLERWPAGKPVRE